MNNSRWSNNEKIDLDEIPALKPLIDRFDYVFVVRGLDDENNIREFVNSKSQQEDSLVADYSNYLKKHIAYARRGNPVFSDEAKSILNEFAIKVASKARSSKNGSGNIWTRSPRRRDSLYRTAKAIARLKLKDFIDVDDANEAVKFYNVILTQLENTVSIPNNPRYEAYNECVTILKQYERLGGITLDELLKKACENNQQVNDYLVGLNNTKSLRIDKNRKTRAVYTMLLNNQNVRKVGENPIVLKWSSLSPPPPPTSNIIERVRKEESNLSSSIILPDAPDAPDVPDIQKLGNEKNDNEEFKQNNFSNPKNLMSDMSGMSDSIKATRYSSKGSVYFENYKEKEKE
jgi:replicative DNA helicase Mcm